MSAVRAHPAREIADGVHWIGGCFVAATPAGGVHYHVSTYLVIGEERTALVDTGDPAHWDEISRQLDGLLGERPLDVVVPTHPELPHAGNLPALAEKYPALEVHGEVRDYHLHYPQLASRLVSRPAGDRIDLGGRALELVPALILDLPNSLWAYDTAAEVLFVSDGVSYIHDLPEEGTAAADGDDDPPPTHLPGQCRLLSGEMPGGPTVEQAAYGTGRALYWTRFVDVAGTFDELERLLARRPARLLAPAHGNVVSDVTAMLAISAAAHRRVYEG